MQGMAGEGLEAILHELFVFGKGGPLQYLIPSIGFIIEKRMTYMLEMYPDLVGPAGFQLAFHKAEVAQPFKQFVMGHGRFSLGSIRKDGHFFPVL